MAKIFRIQKFTSPVARCYKDLIPILQSYKIVIESQDQENYRLTGYWSYGKAQYPFEVACSENDVNMTEVKMTARPESALAMKDSTSKSSIVEKVYVESFVYLFGQLAEALGEQETRKNNLAEKFTRASTKWIWIDWVGLLAIGAGLIFLLDFVRATASINNDFLLDFGIGLVYFALYNLFIRKLWGFVFPSLYKEVACSNCLKAIPTDAEDCPNCSFHLT